MSNSLIEPAKARREAGARAARRGEGLRAALMTAICASICASAASIIAGTVAIAQTKLPDEREQITTPDQVRRGRSPAKPTRPAVEPEQARKSRLDPNLLACIARFPTFDAESGTYIAKSGKPVKCPYLP